MMKASDRGISDRGERSDPGEANQSTGSDPEARRSPFLLLLLHGYKWILSPLFSLFGAQCRFHPECSRFTVEAIEKHGWLRGGAYGLFRVLRCNPLCAGGFEPVPERKLSTGKKHQENREKFRATTEDFIKKW